MGRAGFEKEPAAVGMGTGRQEGRAEGKAVLWGRHAMTLGGTKGLGTLRSALSRSRDSDASKAKAASAQPVRAGNIPVIAQSPRTGAGGCSMTPLGTAGVSPRLKTVLLVLPDAGSITGRTPACPSAIIYLPSVLLHSSH